MAVIHETTMSPTKLELLTSWLPAQPWFQGAEDPLARAGGFRLDDPGDEVGIEFMVVAAAGTAYLVPMTYRGAPLDGDGLIGTAEHGVLGTRYIYDGLHDPVLVTQLVALMQGTAEPQSQGKSATPDPTVLGSPVSAAPLAVSGHAVRDGCTVVADVGPDGPLTISLRRVLKVQTEPVSGGSVTATWRLPSGEPVRGVFATASL